VRRPRQADVGNFVVAMHSRRSQTGSESMHAPSEANLRRVAERCRTSDNRLISRRGEAMAKGCQCFLLCSIWRWSIARFSFVRFGPGRLQHVPLGRIE